MGRLPFRVPVVFLFLGALLAAVPGAAVLPVAAPPSDDGVPSGLRTDSLAAILASAADMAPATSLLIWHHDSLLVERYYRGGRADRAVNLKSASKTILSSLVGIAFRDGLLDSLDQPLAGLLPSYFADLDSVRRGLTLRHALTMQTGLESTSFDNYGAWASSPDWVRFQLQQPLECPPGTCWSYSTGTTHLMAAVVSRVTGQSLLAYARAELFDPLGIRLAPWDRDPQGRFLGGNNMALRPLDLLTYGQLHLRKGRWGDRQLIPREWIEASWESYGRSPYNGNGYGFWWWNRMAGGERVFFAWGYGGQFLFLVPRLELIVVTTASLTDRPAGGRHNQNIYRLLERIIPVMRARHPNYGPMAR